MLRFLVADVAMIERVLLVCMCIAIASCTDEGALASATDTGSGSTSSIAGDTPLERYLLRLVP